jgi:hypothetical protein
MSSVLRSLAVAKTAVTNVVTPHTIVYDDTEVGEYLPIPFTVSNGVLDIAIQDNVTVDLLTPGTFTDSFNDNNNQPDRQASIMGGLAPVSSLGPNMLTFLRNFIAWENGSANDYNLVTNVAIYSAPTMTKIRFNYIPDEYTFYFSDVAPSKSTPDPVSGDLSNKYRVVWIFKSPLVVSFNYDGSNTRYLTFTSTFDAI